MGWYPQASIEPTDRILVLWACSSIDVWLKPIAPIALRGEKLGENLWIGQLSCWGCNQKSLFLRSNEIYPNLLGQRERLLYTDRVRYL
jgi:hypothetical protein